MKNLQNKQKSKVIPCLFLDKRGLYLSKLFFKTVKKKTHVCSAAMSGVNITKKILKKVQRMSMELAWFFTPKYTGKTLLTHPPHLIQTSLFSSITVFSVKNVVLCDPFFPFRIQPSVALEAGKKILYSIRHQLLLRYVL